MSTAESEYTAACSAAREALWLRKLAAALDVDVGGVPLLGDSQAAIAMAKNISVSARTKHMDVRLHFMCKRVAAGDVTLAYVSTVDMLADPQVGTCAQACLHEGGMGPQVRRARTRARACAYPCLAQATHQRAHHASR